MSERICLNNSIVLNGRYSIQKTLGAGGFGVTYLAFDQQLEDYCCVKELFPKDTVYREQNSTALIPKSEEKHWIMQHCIQRFGEEARILQSLQDVDAVVKIYDFFYGNGTCYFVMEYLNGINLATAMKNRGGKLDPGLVMMIADQVGHALIEVHKKGIFHRDIAPDNIFLLADGAHLKLLDFGNAKHIVQQTWEINSVVLKVGYSPPEQYSQKVPQGTYTDVYAFAFTLYYTLTGIKPPTAEDRNREEYTKLSELGYSKELSDVFDRALKLNYRDRTKTINQFLSELKRAVGVGSMGQKNYAGTPLAGSEQLTQSGIVIQQDQFPTERKSFQPVLELYIRDRYCGRFKIQTDRSISVGRRVEEVGFPVGERHVSGHHCDLLYSAADQTFYIMDYSTNGTYINGNRINRGVTVKAGSGDRIALGSQNVILLLKME